MRRSDTEMGEFKRMLRCTSLWSADRRVSYAAACLMCSNGKWLPDFIERLKASAWHQLYLPLLPFTHARSGSINADSLKLQLLTARKKEWWPATADSFTPWRFT